MKKATTDKKSVPVPARVKLVITLVFMGLLGSSIAAGAAMTPESDIPVMLADGEVIMPPWYITVDGEKVALVESEKAAEDVISSVIDEYQEKSDEVLDVQLYEDTEFEQMQIQNGDEPPEILTGKEAAEVLLHGNDGESYLTVAVTREETNRETVCYDEEYKPESDMYVGESRIQTKGEDGIKEVTTKIVAENGQDVSSEVIEEKTIKESVKQVTLTGVREYDGYGGAGETIDEGVSYDEDAVYDTLLTPVAHVCVTSNFGTRWGSMHYGIDLGEAQGQSVYAADDGVVYYSGVCGGYGNLIKIDHGNGMQTYYAHCSSLLASAGQHIKKGDKIALVGSTGNSTGPHLHFEVIINGVRIDPLSMLDI